jgi:carbonic anhydrase/acetyltransferase-like protein (isoleucine patch superfamily)
MKLMSALDPLTFVLSPWPRGEAKKHPTSSRVIEEIQLSCKSNIKHRTSNTQMHIEPDTLPTGHAGIAARLKKGPTIHSSVWVVPGATVLGDVVLEEESSVWYGAVLRGDINRIIIGPRSNIQDNAVVHVDTNYPTTMGELVTVGHNAVVHACTIDNEVLVGMGAIILDDVEVGARSIIGANALVTIGMKIPPGSLVLGSPAKIRRQLTADEQKDVARWAWSYVETAKQFRELC